MPLLNLVAHVVQPRCDRHGPRLQRAQALGPVPAFRLCRGTEVHITSAEGRRIPLILDTALPSTVANGAEAFSPRNAQLQVHPDRVPVVLSLRMLLLSQ